MKKFNSSEIRKAMAVYAVTDRMWVGKQTLIEQVKDCLDGGATCMQIREKNMEREAFLKEAAEIKALCIEKNIPFIVNDSVEVAIAAEADGIHVGQHDMPADQVRKMIGEDMILGVSAQTVEQALKAERDGADYIGVGAVFPTGTKDDADDVKHDTLKAICDAVNIPVVAIGGITRENTHELAGTGIDGIAVVSAIFAQENIKKAAEELCEIVKKELLTDTAEESTEKQILKRAEGVIFDLDGTLVDSLPYWVNAGRDYLAKLGKNAAPDLEYKVAQMTISDAADYLNEVYKLSNTREETVTGIDKVIEEHYRNDILLKKGVKKCLDTLKDAGIPMYIATLTDRYCVEIVLKRLEIYDYFEGIVTATEVGKSKLEPDIYLYACEKLGTAIANTVVFEDDLRAMTTAKKAGFPIVGVADAFSSKDADEIIKITDWYVTEQSL